MPRRRIKVNRPILTLKVFAMATSLERSEKDQIRHLRSNTCHMVNIWWVTVSMPTGQTDRWIDERTPDRYITLSARSDEHNNFTHWTLQVMSNHRCALSTFNKRKYHVKYNMLPRHVTSLFSHKLFLRVEKNAEKIASPVEIEGINYCSVYRCVKDRRSDGIVLILLQSNGSLI